MTRKIIDMLDIISNMGMRYVTYRFFYIVKMKLGWPKIVFPVNPKFNVFYPLNDWKENLPPFFFYGKNIRSLEKQKNEILKSNFDDIKKGVHTFFNKSKIDLGNDYDWITNPLTGHKYDINRHWSEIQDFSAKSGDIKYVWEKARFSYLYDVIRYDYHFDDDQAEFVFNEIDDFLNKNPINQGPNYKCSQEISLRVLNWTFALYYYKDSKLLTEELFNKMLRSIYWQIHHVYKNINFSRISVRNNHAITETLLLYLSDKLFPFFPNVNKWSKKGKQWFEQEIQYQIYSDGTFLQFSMNYHRVVIQLLTWGIQLARLNGDSFKNIVYQRSEKSLFFLKTCMDPKSGKLPNYGSNDGALFFKLTNDDYRNYRSQIDDLNAVLIGRTEYETQSSFWYGIQPEVKTAEELSVLNEFKVSGYYIIQEGNTKTFIRCGSYKDRPCQSDNLHLDLWVDGRNILRDNGTYQYNTSKDLSNYFNGSHGHNTVSIEGRDQMLKGERFIWNYWVKEAKASITEFKDRYFFTGKIRGYKELGSNVCHERNVTKRKKCNEWLVEDIITGVDNKLSVQYWHFSEKYRHHLSITSIDGDNKKLEATIEEKWYSSYYGYKEPSIRLSFQTTTNKFQTKISYRK